MAACPCLASLESWLGLSLGGVEFHGEPRLNRILNRVVMRANRLDQDGGDPTAVRHRLGALDDTGLRDWSRRGSTLVAATKGALAGGVRSPADRRVLRQLSTKAAGGNMDGLRAVLLTRMAARHARRQ